MENLREMFQIMTRRFGLLNKVCCSTGGLDITPIQSHILYEIDKQHNPSMQQIAEILGTEITTFSRQIQTLITMNLVRKVSDPNDRRVYVLSLTAEGKQIASQVDHKMNAFLTEVFSHMNEFERETVIRSIKLLNESMAKSKTCCSQ
ncbi:MarR family transcriptional regulator [Paenibacillus sp. N1-5-1-14]|uniref:MarR family winged helix-turn-helix transcriptional regulator n=1 Tax=Paenibacillus radicibacter TaxID=2972488 RepID=UPI0021594CF4|nr:MarR family transcriptional regulator [Paenibacillus radicibacter]MCR8645439.1 MarR family transcriptional regulator [Paenibacillus radicibacter]